MDTPYILFYRPKMTDKELTDFQPLRYSYKFDVSFISAKMHNIIEQDNIDFFKNKR